MQSESLHHLPARGLVFDRGPELHGFPCCHRILQETFSRYYYFNRSSKFVLAAVVVIVVVVVVVVIQLLFELIGGRGRFYCFRLCMIGC